MKSEEILALANSMSKNTLMETLGIKFTAVSEEFVEATMPVNATVHQPQGLLHGGASAAIAESVGSLGSAFHLQGTGSYPVGIELNASHLRGVKEGSITAKAILAHKGRSLHVWEIKVTDEAGKLVSTCRLTNMIISK